MQHVVGKFPDEAFRILDAIEGAGFEAWFVGGCVRDALMGRPCSDVDIASAASWQDVTRACQAQGMRAYPTGAKHGTVTIVAGEGDGAQGFEVTTFRADSATSADSRHPDSVEFVSSIAEDLERRDFTINAIAWHPQRGIFDPLGGARDIERGVIRSVGCAQQRFREDALRILRACRFASQLGFAIEGETYEAMLSCKHLLAKISAERVTHELDLFLLGGHVHDALMATVDVLSFVLPELVAMKGCPQVTKYHIYDVLEHTAWVVQFAEPERLVRWAAFCHDMGKPAAGFFDASGTEHFYGHAHVSAQVARGMMGRLAVSNAFKESVIELVAHHSFTPEPTEKAARRALARHKGDVDMLRAQLALKRADILGHAPEYHSQIDAVDSFEQVIDEVIASDAAFTVGQLAVNGNDVIALGVAPGPEVGRLLEAALDAVIDGKIANERGEIVEFVSELMNS